MRRGEGMGRIKTLFNYIGLILGEMSSGLIFWTGYEHWRKPTWPIGIALNCLGVAMAFISIRHDMSMREFKYRMGYNDGYLNHRAFKILVDNKSSQVDKQEDRG